MAAQTQDNPTNLESLAETVQVLYELLDLLYPELPSPEIITLKDVQRRYPLTGLGSPAMTAIQQSQRIVRANGDYRQVGLCEFHVGLIYLYWGQCLGAEEQFAEARRQWSFANNEEASVCLGYFAAGNAQHRIRHYEAAMSSYGKTEQWLSRVRWSPPSEGQEKFVEEIGKALAKVQEELREKLWPPDERESPPRPQAEAQASRQNDTRPENVATAERDDTATTNQEPSSPRETADSVPKPVIAIANSHHSATPVPGHENSSEHYQWYQVINRDDAFLSDIPEESWLLVDVEGNVEQPPASKLFLVGSDGNDIEGSVIVRPHNVTPPFSRIYLACLDPDSTVEGASFVRDMKTGKVKLLTAKGRPPILTDKILGSVVGVWLNSLQIRTNMK